MFPRPLGISSVDNLTSVWIASRDAKSRPGSPGIDRQTARKFSARLNSNLESISRELRTGRFHFSRLRPRLLLKPSGKFRLICVPTVKDRLVQRAIGRRLIANDRLGVVSPVSYGFVPGRKITDAINAAIQLRAEHQWVLKTDIQSFFDRIQRGPLVERLRGKLGRSSLLPLLEDVIRCDVKVTDSADQARISELGIRAGIGLRQGMPLSPLLSNFVLRKFDLAVQRCKFRMIRYADDLIFFADSREEALDCLAFVVEELDKLHHEVPKLGEDSKTQLLPPRWPVEFLGVDISYSASKGGYVAKVPGLVIEAIHDDIMKLADISAAMKNGKKFRDVCGRVVAVQNAYKGAYWYAENWEHVEGQIRGACRSAIAKLLTEVFGVETIKRLSAEQKEFFGFDIPLETEE